MGAGTTEQTLGPLLNVLAQSLDVQERALASSRGSGARRTCRRGVPANGMDLEAMERPFIERALKQAG